MSYIIIIIAISVISGGVAAYLFTKNNPKKTAELSAKLEELEKKITGK